MVLSYAPFDDKWSAKPPVYKPEPQVARLANLVPTSDNTECNYIIMGFVASIILMGILDSLRR
jgi:hypothetical protein